MTLFEEKKQQVITELNKRYAEIEDLKASYGYADIKSGFTPFQMQAQAQMIDRFSLSKHLHSYVLDPFKNYGEFVAVLQRFDTFDSSSTVLKDQATKIIEIENRIRTYNQYLEGNRGFVEGERIRPTPTNPELFDLAKDYLIKAQQFPAYVKANYRQAIVREAMCDLKPKNIEDAVRRKLITKKDLIGIDTIITTGNISNYKENVTLCMNMLELSQESSTDEIRTSITGVSFKNEDGSSRQQILAELKNYTNDHGNVMLDITKGAFKGQPSYKLSWKGKELGYVNQGLANQLDTTYGDHALKAEVEKVTGGNGYTMGCNIRIIAELDKVKDDNTESKSLVKS